METKTTRPNIQRPVVKSPRRYRYDRIAESNLPFSLYTWGLEHYHDTANQTITRRFSQFCTSYLTIESLEQCMEDNLRIVRRKTSTTKVAPYILIFNDDPAIVQRIVDRLAFAFNPEIPPTILVVQSEFDALKCLPLLEWFTPKVIILDIFIQKKSRIEGKVTDTDFSIWKTDQLVSPALLFDSMQKHDYMAAGTRLLSLLVDRTWCPPIFIFDVLEANSTRKYLQSLLNSNDRQHFLVSTSVDPEKPLTVFTIVDTTTQTQIHTTSIQQIEFPDSDDSSGNVVKKTQHTSGWATLATAIEYIFKKK